MSTPKSKPARAATIVLALTGIFLALVALGSLVGSCVVIGPGHRGVVISRVSGVEMEHTLDEGLHVKVPFVEWVEEMSIQKRIYSAKAIASSKDLQDVSTSVALNYALAEGELPRVRRSIGMDFERIVIEPMTQEVVKQVTARYTAAELITQRPKVKEEIAHKFRAELAKSYIVFHEVSITNFEFSPSYTRAIEDKQVAEQRALAEEQKKKLAITRAEADKQAQIKHAEAQLTTARLEAEAQELLAQTVTEDVLRLRLLQKWNGQLPTVMSSDGVLPMLGLDGAPTGATPSAAPPAKAPPVHVAGR